MKNRFVKRVLLLVLIIGLAIALPQTFPTTPSQAAAVRQFVDPIVAKAVLKQLRSGAENSPQKPTIKRTAVVQGYGIATWLWGEAGGQSILIQQGKQWKVLSAGGGMINLETLKQQGVPAKIAERLIQKEQAAQQR
jgi:hypothetical protein